MPFNVNDFRNRLTNGGARPSQFEMVMTWPDILRGSATVAAAERDFRFLCETSEIPASSIGDITVSYFGRKLHYPGERTFGTLKLSVINDEDFKVRNAFQTWQRAITELSSTVSRFRGGNNAGSYATDGVVTQYSRNQGGGALFAWKFIGMYPTDVGAIDLGWEKTQEMEKFDVTFQYQWWEPIDASSGAAISLNI